MLSILSLNVAVVALYLAAFVIQVNVLAPYDYLPGVSLLFLPHGIRVLAVLIGRAYAIPGLFVGSLLVSIELFSDSSLKAFTAAVLSAVMPYLALVLVERLRGGRILTESLNLTSVTIFILASAALNALTHTVLFMGFEDGLLSSVIDTVSSMAQGDIGGGLC
jgi:MASE1.